MAFTTYLEQQVLNHVFRGQTYSAPSAVYVGLFTSSGEVSASEYERQEISFSAPTTTGDGSELKNSSEIRFPIAMSGWGEIISAAVYDSQSGGEILTEAELPQSRLIEENDQLIIPSENLTVEIR